MVCSAVTLRVITLQAAAVGDGNEYIGRVYVFSAGKIGVKSREKASSAD